MIRSRKHLQKNSGFTLIELLVCITIFVIMTALMVVKYGNFNQNVLITNLVYDTALAIRTAQNYGLSVKGSKDANGVELNCGGPGGASFGCAYGVAFSMNDTEAAPNYFNNTKFILFADTRSGTNEPNGYYDSSDQLINTYTLKSNAKISNVCAGDDTESCNSSLRCQGDNAEECDPLQIIIGNPLPLPLPLYISFKRPDPKAYICLSSICDFKYAKITIQSSDGSERSISVRSNGQISVDI